MAQLIWWFRDKGDKEDKEDGDTTPKNLYPLIRHLQKLNIDPSPIRVSGSFMEMSITHHSLLITHYSLLLIIHF
ncbi:MAG: hypothetical protein F6K47_05930 [Symploca sp. SIO2E6]|nr:hypothetical protein [Symploca sp. SIO2E6]